MSKFASVMVFVVVGLGVGYFSLMCACRIAMWIGGRLGEAVRTGSPNTMIVAAFWMVGLLVSSIVNAVLGCWAVSAVNGRYPDHAFYAVAVMVMFLLPLLATFLGLAVLAAKL